MAKAQKILNEEVKTVVEVEESVVKPSRPKKVNRKGVVAKCELLNVREQSNTTARIVKCISVGTEVEILGEENNFYKIADGFVMKDFIEVR